MTIRPTGTEPQPFDTIQNGGHVKKIEKLDRKNIKVFNQPHGEYLNRREVLPKVDVNMDKPMKEHLDKLPEETKNKFTDEMKADIEAGMTTKEFIEKYFDELKKIQHGL